MPRFQKKMRRRYNISRIRRDYSYQVHELAKCLGTCKGTIHQWRRKGMPTIDNRRPYRFHGSEARDFLQKQQGSKKKPCLQGQLYCFHCRHPRLVRNHWIEIKLLNQKTMNLIAICDECGGNMHQLCSATRLPEIANTFVIQKLHNEHIADTLPLSLKRYLPTESHNEKI